MKNWKYKIKRLSHMPIREFEGMKMNFLIDKKEMDRMAAYYIHIPKNASIPHSYHKVAHEIILVLAGSGKVHLNRKKIAVQQGDVILVQPPTWHSFSTTHRPMTVLAVTAPYVDGTTDLYHK